MLKLSGAAERIVLPDSHLLYVEILGPFSRTAPQAWKAFWAAAGGQIQPGSTLGVVGLSRVDPAGVGDAAYVYQAGVLLNAAPDAVPEGLRTRILAAAPYARFVLNGPFSQLAEAYPAAFAAVADAKLSLREDFCIERYLEMPAAMNGDAKTEILIPITP